MMTVQAVVAFVFSHYLAKKILLLLMQLFGLGISFSRFSRICNTGLFNSNIFLFIMGSHVKGGAVCNG